MPTIQVLLYAPFLAKLANKEVDWDSDDVRATLHTNSYTPDRAVHDYVNDLTNELGTAGGYTAGGLALGSKTITTTAANSWSQTWAASTAYNVGELRRPTTGNGFVYRVSVAGTSAGTEPTWPTTIGDKVVDSGVTWTCVGRAVVTLDAADIQWPSFTAGPFRHLVLSDRTPGTAATQPLIGIVTFASDQTGGGGNFDGVWDPAGIIAIPIP